MGKWTFLLYFSLDAMANNYVLVSVLVSGVVNHAYFYGNYRNYKVFVQPHKSIRTRLLFVRTRITLFSSSPINISVRDSDLG